MILVGNCDIKINLTLRVFGRRADGYHDICSLFWRLRSPETVEVFFGADCDSLEVVGAEIPGENILVRTRRHIREVCGGETLPSIAIRLYKHLPIGGGVGAGSGNAAALIKLLRAAFGFGGNPLPDIASLGADVAFLASAHSLAIARGTGEVLEGMGENLWLTAVIFFPEWSADTAGAYRVLDEARTSGRVAITGTDEAGEEALSVLERLKDGRRVGTLPNDFVAVAGHESQYGMLSGLSSESGALAWGLCGSGSAYFSLFRPGDAECGIKSIVETIREKEKNEFKWLRQILVLE